MSIWINILEYKDMHTLARFFLSDRNTSLFRNDWSSCMSSGSRRAFSRHLDSMIDLPFWGPLREESSITGSFKLSTKAGFHIKALEHCSPLAPLVDPEDVLFFCWALLTLDSLAGGCCIGWVISPFSMPLDALPLFLFFLGASPEEARVGAGLVAEAPQEPWKYYPQCGRWVMPESLESSLWES